MHTLHCCVSDVTISRHVVTIATPSGKGTLFSDHCGLRDMLFLRRSLVVPYIAMPNVRNQPEP